MLPRIGNADQLSSDHVRRTAAAFLVLSLPLTAGDQPVAEGARRGLLRRPEGRARHPTLRGVDEVALIDGHDTVAERDEGIAARGSGQVRGRLTDEEDRECGQGRVRVGSREGRTLAH